MKSRLGDGFFGMDLLRVVWLALSLGCLPQTALPDAIRIQDVQVNPDTGQLEIHGSAALPEESSLVGSVWFEGKRGLWKIGHVSGGRFTVSFDPVRNLQFISGSYLFRVEFKPEEQAAEIREQLGIWAKYQVAEHRLKVGDAQTRKQDESDIRDRLGRILEEARALSIVLGQRNYHLTLEASLLRGKNKNALPERDRRRLLNKWNEFLSQWDSRYAAIQRDYEEYKDGVFLGLFPDAEQPFGSLFSTLDKSRIVSTGLVYAGLLLRPPAEIQENQQFFREDISSALRQTALKLYQVLGIEPENWQFDPLQNPERAAVNGLTYERHP